MDSLLPTLGRLHPLVVHLPIGILFLLGLLEAAALVSRWKPFSKLPQLSPGQRTFVTGAGAVSALATVAFGWLLARNGGYDENLLGQHQSLGLATAALACGLWLAARLSSSALYATLLVATIAVLSVAGHFGGSLTHGSGYLTAAFAPPASNTSTISDAPFFTAAIQPVLSQHCTACHGPEKTKGGLRLDSFAALLAGGKHGSAIVAGDPARSDLIRRLHLPLDDKQRMPPKGKPQLADNDRQLLEWWVAAGAPADGSLASLAPPPAIAELLTARLGPSPLPTPPLPDRDATLALAAELETSLGIIVRPLARDEPWLEANARFRQKNFGDAELARLAAVAPALRWLDLGETAVTDAGLAALVGMKNLRRLRLDRMAITDVGLAHLSNLNELELLALHHTRVTDAGLATLRPLTRLRSLYLWETSVTPAAAETLRLALTDRYQLERWQTELTALQDKIRRQQITIDLGAPAAAITAKKSPEPTTPTVEENAEDPDA
jgi:Predicted membrane protein